MGADMLAGESVNMLALMDTLQTLGVDAVQANRFVASILKARVSVMEVYGRGASVRLANPKRRDLSIVGKQALDLRTVKPSGEPWDFSRAQDRQEA